ncbi:hypothetical protein EVC12_245 [Rhizobium phage RHph_I42]|nr:hypothetical protein EVC12_245 [Rhizobium phage RHph_I42]
MSNYITDGLRAELTELDREIQEIVGQMMSGCFTPRRVATKMEEIERKLDFIDPEVDSALHAKVKSNHTSASMIYVRLTEKE